MALDEYTRWAVLLPPAYHRDGRLKNYQFNQRRNSERHTFIFEGYPDRHDDFYAVAGRMSDYDFIRVDRAELRVATMSSFPDIEKCDGPLETYVERGFLIYLFFKRDGDWPAGLYQVASWETLVD